MTDVEEEIRRKQAKPKDSRSSTLPTTRELMRLFATTARSTTLEKRTEKQTELHGKLQDVTMDRKQQLKRYGCSDKVIEELWKWYDPALYATCELKETNMTLKWPEKRKK